MTETLPCGVDINTLLMSKDSSARILLSLSGHACISRYVN